jgi:hypothetical protein
MKTAEVAIEHILTGMLALCAFVLPLVPHDIFDKLRHQESLLVGVLGLAYLLGVAFDRLADSILSPMEDYLRLSLANDFLTKNKPTYKGDPFPQDQTGIQAARRGQRPAGLDGFITQPDSHHSRALCFGRPGGDGDRNLPSLPEEPNNGLGLVASSCHLD